MGNKANLPFDHTITSAEHIDGDNVSGPPVEITGEQLQATLQKHKVAQEEYIYLAKLTHFDEDTLRLLHLRFTRIDSTIEEDGVISMIEFASVLQVNESSLLLKRFFNFMDKSDMGSLNFRNFAIAMSMLSDEASQKEKIELSFFLYDLNQDGYIDEQELRQLVKEALNHIQMRLTEQQITTILNNTFKVADTDLDGRISKAEYQAYCERSPRILQPFSIDISRLIHYEQDSRRHHRYSQTVELKKTLHHGPLQTNNKKGRIAKIRREIGKGFSSVKRETTEHVRSIHKATDVCADIDESEVEGSDSYDIDQKMIAQPGVMDRAQTDTTMIGMGSAPIVGVRSQTPNQSGSDTDSEAESSYRYNKRGSTQTKTKTKTKHPKKSRSFFNRSKKKESSQKNTGSKSKQKVGNL